MSEAVLKKDGSSGLCKKPKLDSSNEIVLDAYAITEIVTKKVVFGKTKKKCNGSVITGRVNE